MNWEDFNCDHPDQPARMLQTTVFESCPNTAARDHIRRMSHVNVQASQVRLLLAVVPPLLLPPPLPPSSLPLLLLPLLLLLLLLHNSIVLSHLHAVHRFRADLAADQAAEP